MVVMSGDVGCWCALFGTLVGVSVLSVMWLELESVSEISSPRWSSVYECQNVDCVVRVDGLWRLDVRECCVGLNVGDESASLLVFSVCADGSVVWYFGLSFDSCTATTSGCVVSSRCLSSSTVLLMPFALS